MPKHFQHSNATHGYFSVWLHTTFWEGWFLLRNAAISSDNWRWISQKRLELTGLATEEGLNNFARSCPDVESERRFQLLTNAFGGISTLGIEWAIMMTIQPSPAQQYENRNSLRACSSAERSQVRVTSETRGESKVWERSDHESSSVSSFLPPLTISRSLATRISVHNWIISW